MKIWKNTKSTVKPKEYDCNPYKIFVAKNIHFVEIEPQEEYPDNQSYWEYDLYEYTTQEYVDVLVMKGLKDRADIEYLAMMSDIELDEEEEEDAEE